MRYINSHTPTEVNLSAATGALLHFKFFADFHRRVVAELNRRPSTDAPGIWQTEMARYYKRVSADPSFSLRDHGSIRYESTAQLVQLGLMRDPPEWRDTRAVEDLNQLGSKGNPGSLPADVLAGGST